MTAVVLLAMTAVAGSAAQFPERKQQDPLPQRRTHSTGDWTPKNTAISPRPKSTTTTPLQFRRTLLPERLGAPDENEQLPRARQPAPDKRSLLEWPTNLEEIKALAREKSELADRHERTRIEADAPLRGRR